MRLQRLIGFGLSILFAGPVHAEILRIAIGTQDTTINCAAGGTLIRELKLLEKYLPHDGKYKDTQYDIQWKNFTSGAPLTNEMAARWPIFPARSMALHFKKQANRAFLLVSCPAASRAVATAS